MKKRLLLLFIGTCSIYTASAQWVQGAGKLTTTNWVGVGTSFPDGKFHIQNGGFLLDYAPGEADGGNQDIVTLGSQHPGTKFYFNPYRNAFRGGEITGTQWDSNNVAPYSFAFGYNTKASFQYAFAVGNGSIASGHASAAIGQSQAHGSYATAVGNSNANAAYSFAGGKSIVNAGDYGTAFGYNCLVDGDYGFASGWGSYSFGIASTALSNSQALGQYSLSGGYQTIAQGNNSIAMGQYSTAQSTNSVVIGAGISSTYRLINSNANSLVVGFNSNRATLYVGPSSGSNTFGKVGIGTTTPQSELAVNGTITAKALNLTMTGWPDYVFANGYKRMGLDETEKYIDEHKHLPGVPSAQEIESNGLNVGEMNRIMMEKIEEITLHLIEIKKENDEMKKENVELRKQLSELKDMN